MSNGSDDWGTNDEQPQPGAPQGQPGMQQPGMQQPGMQQPGMQQPGQQQNMVHKPQQQKIKHALDNNDIIVLLLSFFIPGAGHIMLGQTLKGLVILGAIIFTCGAGYIAFLAIMADAYFCLMAKKDREIGDWEFFPDYQKYI